MRRLQEHLLPARRKKPDEHKSWLRDALIAGLLLPLIVVLIVLAIQLHADRTEREKEANAHAAEREADKKALVAERADRRLRDLEALIEELHNNANICRTQLAIVDRNTEQKYKDLAIQPFPVATTRVFETEVRVDDFNAFGDYQSVDQFYQHLAFVKDLVRGVDEERQRSMAWNMGIIMAQESLIQSEAHRCVDLAVPLLLAILGDAAYGIPKDVVDSEGQMPFWTHKPGDGSNMSANTGLRFPSVKAFNPATGQVMTPSGQMVTVPALLPHP